MELIKLGKKGQINLPRRILSELGVAAESMLLVETTPDGAIVLRPAEVSPIEIYDDGRLAEFAEMDLPTSAERDAYQRAVTDGAAGQTSRETSRKADS